MPSWLELETELKTLEPQAANSWFADKQIEWLQRLSAKRGGTNVLFYSTAWLQKFHAHPQLLQVSFEDINGFMSVMKGMDCKSGLTLVLHSPGGSPNAAETIVEYLHQKFDFIEVIIPTYAMSAGTMMSLSANRLVMGRQSQLGPIDAQMNLPNGAVSARGVVDQFNEAKEAILDNVQAAAVWAPVLQSLGPALLKACIDALDYGETMVARWLEKRAFAERKDATEHARTVAAYFNRGDHHKSHGTRIDREETRSQGIEVEDLEADQELQDIVLTNYHISTLIFERTPCAKFIAGSHGASWIKNM